MLRGTYASATGMIAKYKQIDVIGNNIANINSSGFKKDSLSAVSFQSQMICNTEDGRQLGTITAGIAPGEVTTDISRGSVSKTGLSTDLAIVSDGFFAVQGQGGVQYTRNGNFTVDAGGCLALPTGQRLLGQNGPVRVGGSGFQVTSDGGVTVNGTQVNRITLYQPASARGAQKQADGLFSLAGAAAVNGTIRQGYLEESNVNLVDEMTKLMSSSRSYQSCQQAFKISDQSEDLAIEQVGALK